MVEITNPAEWHDTDSNGVGEERHKILGSPESQGQTLSHDFEILLITGMSGAGRSHAAHCVEDMGWYVIDNLPPKLLIPLADMMTSSGTSLHKLAAVIDVRSRDYFDDLNAVLQHLQDINVHYTILFLDASNEALVKRYESVRRPHPLQAGGRLIHGIHEERILLDALQQQADIVIDTSNLSIHQLSTKLYNLLLGESSQTVHVHIFSFGFKYGLPLDADYVLDVRFLPNPFWIPELRNHNGTERSVKEYVLSHQAAQDFLEAQVRALKVALEGFAQEDKHFVTIAIGCTGGQHRSVAMSYALGERLQKLGIPVTISARELNRRTS